MGAAAPHPLVGFIVPQGSPPRRGASLGHTFRHIETLIGGLIKRIFLYAGPMDYRAVRSEIVVRDGSVFAGFKQW